MMVEKKLLPSGGKNRYYYEDWILVSTIKERVIA
jgi:hypothetical protein